MSQAIADLPATPLQEDHTRLRQTCDQLSAELQWAKEDVATAIGLLREVAEHWEGTDAPIGIKARAFLAKVAR